MIFGSVCSGIEAASMAWNPLGWRAAWFSEIDRFACAVLAHHYPHVPNLGDMTNFKAWPDGAIDLLCGGTPCQSYSVAGLRKGLDDPRGDLMLTFGAIAARYRPRWLVWENVPGVLSSNDGRDFGTFLGLLGHLGYGFAYRVLDAQFFGVAQRRRRVFVVGCLGDWRSAAAVLFERHSLSGHPAPRREAAQGAAAGTLRSTDGGSDLDHARAGHIQAFGGNRTSGSIDVTPSLLAQPGSGWKGDFESETFLLQPAHTLRGEGFDASEGGTGRGIPLVPHLAGTLDAAGGRSRGAGTPTGMLLPFDTTQITNPHNRSKPEPGDPCHTLAGGAHAPAIAFHGSQDPDVSGDVTHPVGRNQGQETCVALAMQVRRLTPTECERLQGFPDGFTDIPWRTFQEAARKGDSYESLLAARGMKLRGPSIEECPDGPRYKALGNSWAVPVPRWIGERIEAVEGVHALRRAAA